MAKKAAAYYAPQPLKPIQMRARLNMTPNRLTPNRMERMAVTEEQAEAIDRTALGVFSDCVNGGLTFQEALAAVYLSGVNHAISATK